MQPDMDGFGIAWLIDGGDNYGVRETVRILAQGLAGRGHRTTIIALKSGGFAEACRDIVDEVFVLNEQRPIAGDFSALGKLKSAALAASLARRGRREVGGILRERADFIVVMWPDLIPLAATAAEASQRARVVWQNPNNVGRYPLGLNLRIISRYLRRTHGVALALSAFQRDLMIPHLSTELLYLGADEARFHPQPRLRLPGTPPGAVIIGQVARLDGTKGEELLIEALPRIIDSVHLAFWGGFKSQAYESELRKRTERLGVTGRVHFMGYTSKPWEAYRYIDVACSARKDPEPFGYSIVEAMLSGRPIVAVRKGGAAELVQDGVSGWYANEPTVPAIKEAVQLALKRRDSWPVIGSSGRAHAMNEFSSRAHVAAFESLAEGLIRGSSPLQAAARHR